jgi:signal peptidase I
VKHPWAVLGLVAIIVAVVLRAFVLQAFWVVSVSMEPTLQPGDRVLVDELPARIGAVNRGDIVVFSDPDAASASPDGGALAEAAHWVLTGIGVSPPDGPELIKRVVALPGETWEIRRGAVYVDGRRLAEPYVSRVADRRSFGPGRVPAGSLFVLGDNRTNSNDSRFAQIGYIPRDTVVGRAVAVLWPPSDAGWR